MARGLMRWPALAGLAILAGSVALYRGGPAPRVVGPSAPWRRAAVLRDSVGQTGRMIDSLELSAATVRHLLTLSARGNGLGLISVDSAGRAHPIGRTDSTGIDSAWARLPGHDPTISVLVRLKDYPARRWVIYPSSDHRSLCVSTDWLLWQYHATDWGRVLGPCAYYGAFGSPGSEIARWFIGSSAGDRPDPPGRRYVPDTTAWRVRDSIMWAGQGWELRLARVGLPAAYQSIHLASCAAGISGACLRASLDPPRASPWYYFDPSADVPGLGALSTSLLPDLTTQFGPDRFRAFWQSGADVPTAFEQAFGMSMDAWVHGEVVRYYGPLELGAGNLDRAAISALLWALLFLGLTALIARRLRY